MTTKELFENLLQGKKMRLPEWDKNYYVFINKDGCLMQNNKKIPLALYTGSARWEVYEEPKSILDKEEKEYLEAVLRPFKSEITHIVKSSKNIDATEYICVFMNNWKVFEFPSFKVDTMYKGMKLGKLYTLQDLGLFDRKIF